MRLLIVSLILWTVGPSVSAQDAGQLGLHFRVVGDGFDLDNGGGALGVTYHLSKHVALRPEVAFSDSEFTLVSVVFGPDSIDLPPAPPAVREKDRVLSGGLAVLLLLDDAEKLYPYLGGSYHLQDVRVQRVPPGGVSEENLTSHLWRGFFGLHYRVNGKIAVFGETGIEYVRRDSFKRLATFSSAVGVVFYLK